MNPFNEVEITIEHADQVVKVVPSSEGFNSTTPWTVYVKDTLGGGTWHKDATCQQLANLLYIYGANDNTSNVPDLVKHYERLETWLSDVPTEFRFIP